MFAGTAILMALGLVFALAMLGADRWLPRRGTTESTLADRIEALLPRIQCAQCGYPGCRPYAEAVAAGKAPFDHCPPGGHATVRRLAELLGREIPGPELDPGGLAFTQIARVDEGRCIGCHLCARACPVDAIAGIAQTMHTVIAAHCTGCELCVAPCPVDCIELVARRA